MSVYWGVGDYSSESTVPDSTSNPKLYYHLLESGESIMIETRPCGDGPWMQWVTWEVLFPTSVRNFQGRFVL